MQDYRFDSRLPRIGLTPISCGNWMMEGSWSLSIGTNTFGRRLEKSARLARCGRGAGMVVVFSSCRPTRISQ